MNQWVGIGRLCADPEIKQTTGGTAVATYRLAVNRDYKTDNSPTADFLPCVVYGKGAEFASKYLAKGKKIAVSGSVRTRTYDDNSGQKHYITEIIVDRQEFCESKKQDEQSNHSAFVPDYQTDPDDLPF